MRILYILIFLITGSISYSQIVELPITHNSIIHNEFLKESAQSSQRHTLAVLELPFFDDFSYSGPYPDSEKWLTNDVYINNTFGINPPSVGVATFDGLNSAGTPYGSEGISDHLESAQLDLSNFTVTDEVYLSFYIQSKGNGERPESDDLLMLEFLNSDDEWELVESYSRPDSININEDLPFAFKFRWIEEPRFLHDSFQFRFSNISSGRGSVDLWHLDYVKLEQNGSADKISPDIAFVEAPNSILKKYRAMPWNHYEGLEDFETNDALSIVLFNHFGFTESANPSTLRIFEYVSGTEVLEVPQLLKLEGSINQRDIEPDILTSFTNNYSDITTSLKSIQTNPSKKYRLGTSYHFQQDEEPEISKSNNSTESITVFDNYFAYDDGTAESNIAAKGAGTQVAVEFIANVDDSLRAVQMHIPHINKNVENQFFNLKVWIGSLDSEPIYEAQLLKPLYVDNIVDTLQGFTTYRLQDLSGNVTPVAIPKGSFFIGWQQVSDEFNDAIPIGFDTNTPDATEKIKQNVGTGWIALPTFLQGAAMIRPVVGNDPAINTSLKNIESKLSIEMELYPNPSANTFSIDINSSQSNNVYFEIYSNSGQLVHKQKYENTATLSLPKGYYIVRTYDENRKQEYIKKLIIQ